MNIFTKLHYLSYKKFSKKRKLTLAIDFDGTITNETNDWPEAGTLKENAKDVINFLHDKLNCNIIIWTCRNDNLFDDLTIAKQFLISNDIHYDIINENIPSYKWNGNSRKINADIYIDDEATLGRPIIWKDIKDYIILYKEQNKNKYI